MKRLLACLLGILALVSTVETQAQNPTTIRGTNGLEVVGSGTGRVTIQVNDTWTGWGDLVDSNLVTSTVFNSATNLIMNEFGSYLPLAGGTMTGALSISNAINVVGTNLYINGGEFWCFSDGNSTRIIIGDNGTPGQYGYLMWDSANDYFRIEGDGSNGIKINNNYVSIGNIWPGQPLIVGAATTELFGVYTNYIRSSLPHYFTTNETYIYGGEISGLIDGNSTGILTNYAEAHINGLLNAGSLQEGGVDIGTSAYQNSNAVAYSGGAMSGVTIEGLTYPAADGTSNQVLSTYGNGNLFWKNDETGGGGGGDVFTPSNNVFATGTTNYSWMWQMGTNNISTIPANAALSTTTTRGRLVITAPSEGGFYCKGLDVFADSLNAATGFRFGSTNVHMIIGTENANLFGIYLPASAAFNIVSKSGIRVLKVNADSTFGIGNNGASISNLCTAGMITNFGVVNANTVSQIDLACAGAKAGDAWAPRIPITCPQASGSNVVIQALSTNNVLILRAINNCSVNVDCSTQDFYGASGFNY